MMKRFKFSFFHLAPLQHGREQEEETKGQRAAGREFHYSPTYSTLEFFYH
jgi:hypothetical protein